MTVTDDQLAAIIAQVRAANPPTVTPPPLAPAVTPPAPTVAPPPAGPTTCWICGEHLDPSLAKIGRHVGCVPLPLDEEIRGIVQRAGDGAERSQQRRLGPSEIGIQCDRFIGYKLLDVDPVNTGRDNWLAILGTAMHAWLADALDADNERLHQAGHPDRWVIEERVWLTDALSGSCDLYDGFLHEVDDHKLVGVTTLKKVQKNGPPPKYRVQTHLYGYGHARAGRRVDHVNLIFYPRNDTLRGDFSGNRLYVWGEPYDEQVALDALARLARITELALVLDVDTTPANWALIPAQPDDDCKYCPFFKPGAPSASDTGCPGHTATTPAIPTTIPGLV